MRVYIPSRGRSTRIMGLINQLPANAEVVVMSPMKETSQYRAVLPERVTLIGAPDEWRISEKRKLMGMDAHLDGLSRFIMVDDDVQFLVRESPESWRLKATTPGSVDALFEHIGEIFEEFPKVSHVGVSGREGNNRAGEGYPHMLDTPNNRAMRVVAWRTEEFNGLEHGRVPVMEDFDLTLQSLSRGRENRVVYFWANGQRSTQDTGGCSVWRTREVHDSAAQRLAELHPLVVRTRSKKNKTGSLAERLEVTVQWKKAADIGARYARAG